MGDGSVGVSAKVASGQVTVAAKDFACANCHGKGAEGSSEGSFKASSLLPSWLMRPTEARPAYDSEKFFQSVRQGLAANGRQLATIMPRYEISKQQSDQLWLYLSEIEFGERTGVYPDRVEFGVYGAIAAISARKCSS